MRILFQNGIGFGGPFEGLYCGPVSSAILSVSPASVDFATDPLHVEMEHGLRAPVHPRSSAASTEAALCHSDWLIAGP